ncbi:MAG: 50S ribosomal protein L21 [Deltaproteobacteria bacterium]|jgi:large subunit ribosomal protein L21|nr:50S ribosomal protein L21 [Deltaproteobacteria bacterium]MDA8307226.1 50S ribosomal protein L21 [Deltaproteobacteria bacterium]
MYAIFKSGGRQYEAKPGQVIKVEKISGEIGENVTLSEVLLFSEGDQLRIGRPLVEGVAVTATIVGQGRMPKIVIFKHKRRKDYRKKQGHRQDFTAVRVENIG